MILYKENNLYKKDDWGGIRTHETNVADLKSAPFDRSGTQPDFLA